jgi:electron transport complex protein RnfD
VAAGAFIAVLVGQALAGGIGNYLWHPVAMGRVAVQLLFAHELTSPQLPVLAPGSLLWGSLDRATPLPDLASWSTQVPPAGGQAWLVTTTETLLCEGLPRVSNDPGSALAAFVRDLVPPWQDTLTGVAGGAIGEACGAAILIVAGLLLWRGLLRWPMVAGAIASAALAAAILPVQTYTDGAAAMACPLPGLTLWEGLPVGAAYVLYHLTAGGFLFVVLLLAPDPSSSPLTSRGHLIFGIIIGLLTIVLRVSMGVPAAAYWALLAANTLVPTINRLTRRRVLGT